MGKIDVAKRLSSQVEDKALRFASVKLDSAAIHAVLINEVVPADPDDDFYGKKDAPEYLSTTLPLFRKAGADVESIQDILALGIYITNAVKTPKATYTVDTDAFERSWPALEKELELFPNLRVIMLMGDVAKKAFNRIAKKNTRKPAIPSGATYKLRANAYYYGDIRVFPSYIITGGNILIEKSKVTMIVEDIAAVLKLI